MAKKNKKKQREQSRRRRERRQSSSRSSRPAPASRQAARGAATLEPLDPSSCYPPIYVDADRRIVPEPLSALGLSEPAPSPEAIRAAWRDRLLERPPEQHPEEATVLRAARDRLLDPEHFMERSLGVLHVPRPDAFGLSAADAGAPLLDAESRLFGQALLYAMLEEALQGPVLEALLKRQD